MLIILIAFTLIYSVMSAALKDTDSSYVLAKVLFYKSASGDFAIANGPVPALADLAIKDDLLSRMKDTRIKVVSIFNGAQEIPQSVDIIKLIKGEQKPVFVAEVKPRLSRTIKDWWNNLWGLNKKVARKRKSPEKVTTTKETLETCVQYASQENETTTTMTTIPTNIGSIKTAGEIHAGEEILTATTMTTIPIDSETSSTDASVTSTADVVCEDCTTTPRIDNDNDDESGKDKITKKYEQEDSLKDSSLEPSDYFIPNDVFYSIEKRCVNWSDACDVQTGGMLDMSAANFNYVNRRPKFSPNGPKID